MTSVERMLHYTTLPQVEGRTGMRAASARCAACTAACSAGGRLPLTLVGAGARPGLQEPPTVAEGGPAPPEGWPEMGGIQYEGVSAVYREELPSVLHDLTFEIAVGECHRLLRARYQPSLCVMHYQALCMMHCQAVACMLLRSRAPPPSPPPSARSLGARSLGARCAGRELVRRGGAHRLGQELPDADSLPPHPSHRRPHPGGRHRHCVPGDRCTAPADRYNPTRPHHLLRQFLRPGGGGEGVGAGGWACVCVCWWVGG